MEYFLKICSFFVLLTMQSCDVVSSEPGALIVTLHNETGNDIKDLEVWGQMIGDSERGQRHDLTVESILVQGTSVMTDYGGMINDETLKPVLGWCGTGIVAIDQGQVVVDMTKLEVDGQTALWFEIQ